GEYRPLAEALGLDVVRLHPGGTARLNPLDPGPDADALGVDELARRQGALVATLLACVLGRDLSPIEDAAVGWALEHLVRRRAGATLVDVADVLADPTEEMASRARTSTAELARSVAPATYGLGKLLDRSLRGMFDGPTSVALDWSGRGLLLDLSAVHHDPEALTLVMVATTAWLRAALARPDGPPRLQVLDEAWCLLAQESTARYLQACWKLGMGLLGDTQTRVLFRQSSDQITDAVELLGLSTPEAALLPRLARGRALWKIGNRSAVVQHVLGGDCDLYDTDTRMVGTR